MIMISDFNELSKIFTSNRRIVLYGAGYYLNFFLAELQNINPDFITKIEFILVKNMQGNPSSVNRIAVRKFSDDILTPQHDVLLTLGKRYIDSVCKLLKDTGSRIVSLNFDMFYWKPYQDVFKSIEPFLTQFRKVHSEKLISYGFQAKPSVRAWTCWWQGEDCAPEIVKACWSSQRRYLQEKIPLTIITKDNYKQYIALPDYIFEKVRDGNITLTTLSDIIRVNLLYKYGGIWFDSTLLVIKALPMDIFDFPIYTRNIPETQYCTKTVWADWFMSAKPGNLLFRFVSGAFLYYYSVYDRIQYYFTIDYLIAICCNMFQEVQEDFMNVPYNNESALELGKHLQGKFDQAEYVKLIGDSYVQKLSYKIKWNSDKQRKESIYMHIIESYF